MGKGIFVTGTGTDIGKTYVTALIVKKLADAGIRTGYYKAALSGAKSIGDSDAGYVKKIAGITQEDTSLLSYLYQNAVSPHLAAQIEGNPVDPEKIKKDFDKVKSKFDYVTVEGSGGIVCPIRWDKEHKILLEDIVKALNLNTLVTSLLCLQSATTSSTGGLILALKRAFLLLAQKGGIASAFTGPL